MSQNHGFKEMNTSEAFKQQCFWWESRASVDADFDLFNFQDPLHAQEYKKTQKERS